MSAAPESLPGNVATDWTLETVSIDAIVFDHALQARGGLNEEAVRDYLEAYNRGVRFPPLRLVRVDGRLLCVDGWHRHAVYKLARVAETEAHVRDGTRRDAVFEAVQANNDHGLQRTRDDRRRAVRMLLMDAEWCALSSRDLADMAKVSHTFVDQQRKRYGVAKAEVLTEARAVEVDGELPAVWRDLLAATPDWQRGEVERIRTCRHVAGLLDISGYSLPKGAIEQRLSELAVEPWPYAADKTAPQRETRVKHLDTIEDLARAIEARECPDRIALFGVLRRMQDLTRLDRWSRWDELMSFFAGRTRCIEMIRRRRSEIEREQANDPKLQAEQIRRLRQDPDPSRQAALIRACSEPVLRALRTGMYSFNEAALDALRARHTDTAECPDPSCDGWSHRQINGGACVSCNRTAAAWRDAQRRHMFYAAQVLRQPGYVLRVDGVVVDAAALKLLSALSTAETGRDGDDSWLRAAPREVREALGAWRSDVPDEAMVVDADEDPERVDDEAVDDDDVEGAEPEPFDDGGEE